MKWTEARIAQAICRQTLQSKCVVLVDRCKWTGDEADVLGVTTTGRLIDIEIKISRTDLRADAQKSKWWVPAVFGQRAAQREWPRSVWKHYYCLPAEVWADDLIAALPSPRSGVLLISDGDDGIRVTCARRATPCRDAMRLTGEQILDVARLATLRMLDAYVERDRALEDEQRCREAA